jgi:hypothetical protein
VFFTLAQVAGSTGMKLVIGTSQTYLISQSLPSRLTRFTQHGYLLAQATMAHFSPAMVAPLGKLWIRI